MEKQEKDASEVLDLFEKLAIDALTPSMVEILRMGKDSGITQQDPRIAARNIIGKIGLRIAFGKEIADPIIAKQ